MRLRKTLTGAAALALVATGAAAAPPATADDHDNPQQAEVILTPVAGAAAPVAGAAAPGGEVWIAERAGLVRPLGDDELGDPVLDLTADISTDGEGGLLGIAFDDDFSRFYASYTDVNGDTAVDEFTVADGQLQPETRRSVFSLEQPFSNHNGGDIAVGPDGMLYLSLGDGGSSGDPLDAGQDLTTLLGTIIRIDPTGDSPYAIPPDNPFVDDPEALDEIWAYGLRNPWRFSFDAQTGDMWIADVGQNLREEVNWQPANSPGGENYGWARMEGTLPFSGEEPDNHVPPAFEYDNDGARCSVTGGYVYRGSAIPQLQGSYLFSDFCDGTIRGLELAGGEVVGDFDLGVNAGNVVSFVEGPDLELYVLNMSAGVGTVFRIDAAQPQQAEVTLTEVTEAAAPTAGAPGPDGAMWFTERAGTVRVLDEQGLGEPVLDISDETTTEGERGLIGITFDEDFSHLYISFTDLDGHNTVDEIEMVDGELQLETRRTIFFQEQPGAAHNSGTIKFGPDGMLYISIGDGDFSFDGDPLDAGQDLGTLLGKLLRIDLAGGDPYGIPADNPFVDDPEALDEIWAYGLRNPWRFTFDAETGDLWLGDVGQFTREEVNWQPANSPGGENYGWARMEGTLLWSGEEPENHVPPVFEWEHPPNQCSSVTGGYVYRGAAIPELTGQYLFTDWCDGDIRALAFQDGQVIEEIDLEVNGGQVASFAQDADGEIYVLDLAGTIHRLDPVG